MLKLAEFKTEQEAIEQFKNSIQDEQNAEVFSHSSSHEQALVALVYFLPYEERQKIRANPSGKDTYLLLQLLLLGEQYTGIPHIEKTDRKPMYKL
ncbi:hypothetical protein COU24_02560 [Candidatus Kuenenbacteria bacterium CG10_big_fil_rev_8_21_14_0_10_39_14]|uniref:Uncharacterized protein n=4 Tax=Candidatus Kueneniibacteriota TaxID=1752740 RepID=A0A2M7MI44_9BACT|nr:hypothetical protein [Candidatus Kuenenbacteria bacterium]PIP29185.1 MAG: hypothetical protein COX28_00430 [Candidatus Kuenenbacteria bacterium CG23_combo_of_CG06-09_8_20_14_all_39_39]PIP75735.1 MAG: hypothetical protein COW86_02090 [Candidatus Kuenenbacteria bacterium CG22_combo_CG10-13_8_21_14_all_39_9]PIR80702.1 MAG: hypothetical protein COU24_02560 [Candidatus Kuenenbacteria bacterium CG10_big_fil_rev_8_21_14_0_10_39_14]PIX92768.1 MAG: hypothetical protein COZ26_00060 [Candidatus Kuenenb